MCDKYWISSMQIATMLNLLREDRESVEEMLHDIEDKQKLDDTEYVMEYVR